MCRARVRATVKIKRWMEIIILKFKMAAEEDRGVSTFPQPPALFYKLYTDENVKAGKVPAPPLPVKGTYSMFGNKFDVS